MPWYQNLWQVSPVVQPESHPRLRPLTQPIFPDPSWMEIVDTLVLCSNCGVDLGEILPCATHVNIVDTCKCNTGLRCLLHEPCHYHAWASYLAHAKCSKIYLNFGRAPPASTSGYPTPAQSAAGIITMCLLGFFLYQILGGTSNGSVSTFVDFY